MSVQTFIAETLLATQTGMTFMIAAHLIPQEILQDPSGAETPGTLAILDAMHTVQEQMVNSAIAFHFYNALEESIGDIPLLEDSQPTYYRHPSITRIHHF
jgi:hypothetical protein